MKPAPEELSVRIPTAMAIMVEAKIGASNGAFSRYVRALVEADLERRLLAARRPSGARSRSRRAGS